VPPEFDHDTKPDGGADTLVNVDDIASAIDPVTSTVVVIGIDHEDPGTSISSPTGL
jgi:hypothetical protein